MDRNLDLLLDGFAIFRLRRSHAFDKAGLPAGQPGYLDSGGKGWERLSIVVEFCHKRCSSSVLKHQSYGLQVSLKTASTSGSNFRAIKAPTWQKPFDGPNMKSSPLFNCNKPWQASGAHSCPCVLLAISWVLAQDCGTRGK